MMMKIDRNNYETYFIDYLDGTLSLEAIDLLLDFMNENPDLKEELKGLEHIKIEGFEEDAPAFNHLKRDDFDHREIFEETCIRAIENELSNQELNTFNLYIDQSTEHKKEFELFRATISKPDPFIIFENKKQLKKKGKGFLPFYWYAAAAVVLVGLFLFLPDRKLQIETAQQPVASVQLPVNKSTVEPHEIASSVIQKKKSSQAKHKIPQQKAEGALEVLRVAEWVEPLNTLTVSVAPEVDLTIETALLPVDSRLSIRPKSYSKYLTIEEYLADVKQENKGALGRFALNTLKRLSGDTFDYSTNGGGKVEKLEFNSKLLAFTIPLNSEE